MVFNYFGRCLKKNSKYIPSTLVLTLILALLLVLIFGFMFSFGKTNANEGEMLERLGVGIVGDMEDEYILPGIDMVKNLDVSESYLDIMTFESEDDAISALEKGKIVGYVFIPNDFLTSIRRGNNTPAKYVSKNSPVDLGPIIVNDVLGTISNLVVESQSGIFAMENFYKENGLKGRKKALNAINMRYLGYVFTRDNFTEVHEVTSAGTITLGGYYVCGLAVLIVLLVGVLSANCVIKHDLSLPRLLSTKKCGSFSQILCENISYLLLPVISVFVLIMFMGIYNVTAGLGIDEFIDCDLFDFIILFLNLLPMIFVLGTMQMFIYEMCSNVISATLLQFIISIGLAYISGCFYPEHFFPETVRNIASVLPVGYVFGYAREVLSGYCENVSLAVCFGYVFAFIVLSALVRNIKIRSRIV